MRDLLEKYNLPKKVKVIFQKVKEGGYVVEFPDLPGCHTQVADLSQLHENVTDVILTYFDVPRSKANKMVYIPKTKDVTQTSTNKYSNFNVSQTRFDLFVAA